MPDDELSPEEEAELERLAEEAVREAARVGVDWDVAAERLRELALRDWAPPADGATEEVTLGLDLTVLLRTLRRLPDGAGTERFLAEYEAAESGDTPPED
jgi:hypothetical protein